MEPLGETTTLFQPSNRLLPTFSIYTRASSYTSLFELNKINEPVIFDMPCNFAWFINDKKSKKICLDARIDVEQMNLQMKNILEDIGCVVLVEPGQDFEDRVPDKKDGYYEFIWVSLTNYSERVHVGIAMTVKPMLRL